LAAWLVGWLGAKVVLAKGTYPSRRLRFVVHSLGGAHPFLLAALGGPVLFF